MATVDQLEFELALLLNGRADCEYTREWAMVRKYDRDIMAKIEEIRVRKAEVESLTVQLFANVKINRGQ